MFKTLRSLFSSRKRESPTPNDFDPLARDDDIIESEQNLSDFEQTLSDQDQSATDVTQQSSDEDESGSISDQRGSDSDQAAADRDQKSADREHERTPRGTAADQTYVDTAKERNRSELEREEASTQRQMSALQRASAGFDRDESADVRDRVAEARDKAAAARDRREAFEDGLVRESLAADDEHLRAALALSQELRERSAIERKRAAEDRARAAADRLRAAEERRQARAELQSAQMDALTGAYMRDLGYLTLENEIVRSRRSEQGFVVAFLDVDGLKRLNDEQGHAAGDELLKKIVEVLRKQLRAYDPVVRVGGDEFLCGLVATDMETARKRATDISSAIDEVADSSVTIGLAELKPEDSLDALISRADYDMYHHKPS